MKDIINDYLDQIKIGRKQSYKNLTMFPLLSAYSSDLDYLLLDEALREGLIEVAEVSEEGSVQNLKVTNKSPKMVLILDGEELVGARQNRIVNTTILVQAKSTLVIPVSCVEEGRWSYNSPQFYSQERIMPSGLRAMKAEQVHYSITNLGTFRSDQAVIWNEISQKAERRKAPSPSMAMAEIYEKDSSNIDEYLTHFSLIDSQVGAIFMINGRVAGLDCLGKPDTFSKVFRKLLQSYALDAVDWFDPEKEHKPLKSEVTNFMKASQSSQMEARPSVGLGRDWRMESKKITGFALALDDQILHLCIFPRGNGDGQKKTGSRMERYTRRRQNRLY